MTFLNTYLTISALLCLWSIYLVKTAKDEDKYQMLELEEDFDKMGLSITMVLIMCIPVLPFVFLYGFTKGEEK